MEEKNRKEPRFIAQFDGYYRLGQDFDWYPCFIFDISDSGASLRLNQTMIKGDEIEICLNPNNENDAIPAKVANVSGKAVGIQFTASNGRKIIELASKKAFEKARVKK